MQEEVLTVAYEISLGRAKQACSILIGPSCQAAYDPWSQFWNVTIPGDKPTVTPIPDPKVSELDTKYTDPSEQQPSLGQELWLLIVELEERIVPFHSVWPL